MKNLILTMALSLFLVVSANAAHLSWDAQIDADGFILYHCIVDDTTVNELTLENINIYDLENLGLTEGVRYEFFLKAYNEAGISGESNHIQWMCPFDPIIIKMLGAPVNIMINP